jgi:hypothetical protein
MLGTAPKATRVQIQLRLPRPCKDEFTRFIRADLRGTEDQTSLALPRDAVHRWGFGEDVTEWGAERTLTRHRWAGSNSTQPRR